MIELILIRDAINYKGVYKMSLNNYTEEARHFLEKMNALNEDIKLKL